MKIVFDLQCLQGSSRYRGIGRYSLELTKAFIRQAPHHEIYLLLNNHDLDGLEFVYNEFNSLLPEDRIKLLTLPDKIADTCYHNTWRIQATETLVEAYLTHLAPDIVYILSLFEGLNNQTITSCNHLMTPYLKVITLYDLIPFIYSDFYLSKIRNKHFFLRKFQQLKKADLLVSISEASAKEAIELFSLEKNKIINGSVGLEETFRTYRPDKNKFKALALNYKINKKFIFYLGGNDFRKNILNLIKAFVASPSLWNEYQLLIITAKKSILLDKAIAQLIKPTPLSFNDILLFDHVEEEALLAFYAHCSLFVFPSLHEGFGLPIIEAMACGAPVIGSNVSSIPEALNCPEALFDPYDPKSISQKMIQALENDSFNLFLRNHARTQHKQFSWFDSAQKVLHALENLYEKKNKGTQNKTQLPFYKKRVAYLSPLPPDKSGIAYYSVKLVKELALFYDVVLITSQKKVFDDLINLNFTIRNLDWFKKNTSQFDFILYQLGNSSFHFEMFELIERYPGIIVLHDFYLSEATYSIKRTIQHKNNYFLKSLYMSHGVKALNEFYNKPLSHIFSEYPCNKSILNRALGIIVLSDYSLGLTRTFYGNCSPLTIQKILPPHAARTIHSNQKIAAKKQLGFQEQDFLICSFGYLTANKLIDKIIESCIQLLHSHKNVFLVFVGDFSANHYKKTLRNLIKTHRLQKKVFFKYFTEQNIYEKYLVAADTAIQLRSFSRGEMSAALLDCLAYGIPTLINTHGAHQEIPDEVVFKISNTFTELELTQAIERLCFDTMLREKLSNHCREYIGTQFYPAKIGQQFHEVMEHFYTHNVNFKEQHLIKKLGAILATPNEKDIQDITDMMVANRTRFGLPKVFIDMTILFNKQKNDGISSSSFLSLFLKEILTASFDQFDIEAVHYQPKDKIYYSALQWVSNFFSLPTPPCKDYQLNFFAQDRLLIPFKQTLLEDMFVFERIRMFYFKRINTYLLIESTHDLSVMIDYIAGLHEKNKSTRTIHYFSYIKAILYLVETTKVALLMQEKWQRIETIVGTTLHFIFLKHQQSLTQQIETILLEKSVMQSEMDNNTIFSPVC